MRSANNTGTQGCSEISPSRRLLALVVVASIALIEGWAATPFAALPERATKAPSGVDVLPSSPSASPRKWRFQFGVAHAEAGWTAINPGTAYSAPTGFGFEPFSEVSVVAPTERSVASHSVAAATATKPFFFSIRVPEGNYRVTVTLGDPSAESVTTVKAETRRLMCERVRTRAGEFLQRTFAVNVRTPRLTDGSIVNLDPRERDPVTGAILARDWDDRLTLEFSGEHPSISTVEIIAAPETRTLFLVGDSTVTDQPTWPASSWGQMLTRWFTSSVAVANHAESGETLKGFLREHRWRKVLESIKPGDVIVIEFGTNDSKASGPQNIYPGQDFAETYSPATSDYRQLLQKFVTEARAHGAFVFIASPSARRGETQPPTSLQPYADAAMAIAQEMGAPGIDLNRMGATLNVALGAMANEQFADRTHHVEFGSYLQAKCIALGIRESGAPLAKHLVPDFQFDPTDPHPTRAEFALPPDR